jgi:competence protein ComEC
LRTTPSTPVVGVVLNVIAVPIGELAALPIALLHAVLALVPAYGSVLRARLGAALLTQGALGLLRWVAHLGAQMPAVELPPPTSMQTAVIVCLGFAMLSGARTRPTITLALAAVLSSEAMFYLPRRALRVTHLDVAQGDSTLIELPDGENILIDAGGVVGSPLDIGERAVAPMLRARRIRELAVVVLSHPHPDHYGGLLSGTRGVRVREIWDTGQGEQEGLGGSYAAWLSQARSHDTKILRPAAVCGTHAIGGAALQVLAPCPNPEPDRNANDNSFVLRLTYGRRSFMFTGDAEHDEEQELLRAQVTEVGRGLASDVLKVGHHGSRTSTTPAFLEAVHPKFAVISSGVRNRFGHPHRATLETLAERPHLRVLRTDHDGAITFVTDGDSLEVQRARPQ